MTRDEEIYIKGAVLEAFRDNRMGGKYYKAFEDGVRCASARLDIAVEDIKRNDSAVKTARSLPVITLSAKEAAKELAEYTLDNYTINGRTFREWIQAFEDIAEAMEKIQAETLQAVEEWDHAKAAGFRRAAEIIEKALSPETETTAEQIGRKERDG